MDAQSADEVTAVAAALAAAVRKGGTYLASDPKRVRATMSDLLGSGSRSSRAHVDAVVVASEEGVPERLVADQSCADSLIARLGERGLDDRMAEFAVASWRFALGQTPDAPSEPTVHTGSAPAVTEPTPPSTVPVVPTPPPRPAVPATTLVGPSGHAFDPAATVLPTNPPATGIGQRPLLIAAVVAVLVLGGAVTAAIVLTANGDTATEITDKSDGTATDRSDDRPGSREPRALPQPTPEWLAGSDISGEWEDTATTIDCQFINGCEDPEVDLPLFLKFIIGCPPKKSQLRRQGTVPDGTCLLLLVDEFDGNARTDAELVVDGQSYVASGVLKVPDGWFCDHPDGTSGEVYDWSFVATLAPAAAFETETGWQANQLRGTLTMTAPGAPGGCARAFVSYDISMIRRGA